MEEFVLSVKAAKEEKNKQKKVEDDKNKINPNFTLMPV